MIFAATQCDSPTYCAPNPFVKVNPNMEKIVVGCDHGGFALKEILKKTLQIRQFDVIDVGCHDKSSVDYPDIGRLAVEKVLSGICRRGILICGTGIGMSIFANRYRGIRATLCNDHLSARLSREHNNSNFLVLGGRILGDVLATDIMETWLETEFQGNRHQSRLDRIDEI